MSKDDNELQKRYLMRKIKRLRPFFDDHLCYPLSMENRRPQCVLPAEMFAAIEV